MRDLMSRDVSRYTHVLQKNYKTFKRPRDQDEDALGVAGIAVHRGIFPTNLQSLESGNWNRAEWDSSGTHFVGCRMPPTEPRKAKVLPVGIEIP
eukprot:1195638-Prorocentrum_minimum.AAC.9